MYNIDLHVGDKVRGKLTGFHSESDALRAAKANIRIGFTGAVIWSIGGPQIRIGNVN